VIGFGILGVLSRYGVGLAVPKLLPPPFPYGTFLINITGAFAIGVIHVLGAERTALSADLRIGIMVGFLGGYTTFSSYCLEAVRLVDEAEYLKAALYFIGSPSIGFGAAASGMILTRFLTGGPSP
jgi:CrcB protein